MAPSGQLLGTGLSTGVLGVVGCGALGVGVASDFTTCPFRLATGVPCPLCGVTHSLLELGSGDFGEALEFSLLGPLVVASALAFLVVLAVARFRALPLRLPRPLVAVAVSVVLASWAVRLVSPI